MARVHIPNVGNKDIGNYESILSDQRPSKHLEMIDDHHLEAAEPGPALSGCSVWILLLLYCPKSSSLETDPEMGNLAMIYGGSSTGCSLAL